MSPKPNTKVQLRYAVGLCILTFLRNAKTSEPEKLIGRNVKRLTLV